MGTIYDTVMVLGQSAAKKRAKQDEELRGQTYIAAAKNVGDKAYIVQPDGTRTELLTLESVDERENWAKAVASFTDKDGTKHKMSCTLICDEPFNETSDTGGEDTKRYPSAVYTAAGKLVHLAV